MMANFRLLVRLALCWSLIFSFSSNAGTCLLFDSRYSTLRVASGATLSIDSPISAFDGTLIKRAGATITGSNVTFVDGILEDSGNSVYMSGIFVPAGTLSLIGNGSVRVEPGRVIQAVSIKGTNNKIEGQPSFGSTITLTDASTTVTFNIQSQINQNIILNGGALCLGNDLGFSDGNFLSGNGNIFGNNYELATGCDAFTWAGTVTFQSQSHLAIRSPQLDLTGVLTFRGNTSINGQGNILNLSGGGKIIVPSNSTLLISDLALRGIGASAGSFVLRAPTSTIRMSNVDVGLDGNITTTVGTVIFRGPGNVTVKNNTWTFSGTSLLTVDGVTLWKDSAGALTGGDIAFAAVGTNRSLPNSGTISDRSNVSCCVNHQSQLDRHNTQISTIDAFERSCCSNHQSQLDRHNTQISVLDAFEQSCCANHQSQLDRHNTQISVLDAFERSCCSNHQSQLDRHNTQISVLDAFEQSCCANHQSQLDRHNTQISVLDAFERSCCSNHQSQLDLLGTSTRIIRSIVDSIDQHLSRVDVAQVSCCTNHQSQLDRHNTQISVLDAFERSCCSNHQSQLDRHNTQISVLDAFEQSCCANHQSQLDRHNTQISVLDAFERSCCSNHQSQLDRHNTQISVLDAFEQSCCSNHQSQLDLLGTSTEIIRSIVDSISFSAPDGIISRISSLESCCEYHESRIDVVGTSTEIIRSIIDAITFSSPEGLASRIDLLESCCEYHESRIDSADRNISILDAFERSCCSNHQSQLDLLGTSTKIIRSIVDSIDQHVSRVDVAQISCCSNHQSQLDRHNTQISVLDAFERSCCSNHQSQLDQLVTSTRTLLSLIDSLTFSTPDDLSSRLNALETCCAEHDSRLDTLETSTAIIRSIVDAISFSSPDGIVSRLEALETCCESNESRIDKLERIEGSPCVIDIIDELYFLLPMLPLENQVVIFNFNPCYITKNTIPRLIFDPTVYGNGGRVHLPRNSRVVVRGQGIIEMRDGVAFDMGGTAFDPAMSDWPAFVIEDRARMMLNANTTVTVGGLAGSCSAGIGGITCDNGGGCFLLSKGSQLILDQPNSHFIVGENATNDIFFNADFGSLVVLNDATAQMTFHTGTYAIDISNHSALGIFAGTFEINMMNGNNSAGLLRSFLFREGSSLEIQKIGTSSGLLRFAPNFSNDPTDIFGPSTIFSNETGIVYGDGDIQYKSFDTFGNAVVDTTLQIKENIFSHERPLVETFMELTYVLERGIVESPDATILAQIGTRPNASQDGRLAAFCVTRDGSIVGLAQGDHDVYYDRSVAGGALDLIRGYDATGSLFTITGCDEGTRTPPAPPTQ